MCDFDGIWRSNYFGGEKIGRAEVEVRAGKLKNGKATGKDDITGEMTKGGGNRVLDRICRLCNMGFESRVVPEDWRLFHSTRVRERGLNIRTIEVIAC